MPVVDLGAPLPFSKVLIPGVITRPALEIVIFFKVFALAFASENVPKIRSVAITDAKGFIDFREFMSGHFSGPICPLDRSDVLIRMGAIRRRYKDFCKSDLSSPHKSSVEAKNSQINFRFIDYSPQPRDVIYGYLEVTTFGTGTDRKLRK